MAKENTVYLYGLALSAPKCKIDTKGNFLSGKLILHTLRRSYATEESMLSGVRRWDYPCVFSRNSKIIEDHMLDIKEGDMVRVKGTFCTKEVRKRFLCPVCNHEEIKDGVVIYVDPIFLCKSDEIVMEPFNQKLKEIATDLQGSKSAGNTELAEKYQAQYEACMEEKRKAGYELLLKNEEVSNEVKIMGTLCREPSFYENPETRKRECTFQIASNRIRRILEDEPEKRTDYPWVKAFGREAAEYYAALHINSSIYINGAIEVRSILREVQCEKCGTLYKRMENASEIVPYGIEYLTNCDIPERKGEDEDVVLNDEEGVLNDEEG